MKGITNPDTIKKAVAVITKNGTEFPRAVFANKLAELGLTQSSDWVKYGKEVVLNPKNHVGRTLVLLRTKEETLKSPAILVARGRGGPLPESYLQPHAENVKCVYEKLSLLEGNASLIMIDKQGKLLESIPVTKKIIDIKPGDIHTVVFESPLVVLFEEKKVPPGLEKVFVPSSVPEGNVMIPQLLKEWHEFADSSTPQIK